MIPVSQEYREAIQLHRTQGVRNQMHASISFGVFAEGAKEDSSFSISLGLPYSNANNMYEESQSITTSYATWEKDFFRLDRVQSFVSSNGKLAQGFISKTISDIHGQFEDPPTIDIDFGKHYNVVGLSFLFDDKGEQCAKQVTVSTYDGDIILEQEIATNENYDVDFKPELKLDDFNRMKIEFVRTKPYQRVRLNRLLFGIGYIFNDRKIVSLKHKRSGHPLSLAIPQNELEFVLYNENNQYDIDSPNSIVRFFEQEQEVVLKYGYDISGMGDIEWFDGGLFYLYSWDTKGHQATFTAKDIFYKLTTSTFKKGVFDKNYHSLSDLASQVFDDGGVQNYSVNERHLYFSTTQLPLPHASHAECLQLIANHCASTLNQSVDRTIKITNRSITPKSDWYASVSNGGVYAPTLPYSNPSGVLTDDTVEYSTWGQDEFAIDGSMVFLPNDDDYLNAGAVINVFPNSNGYYYWPDDTTTLTGVWVNMQREMTFGGIKVTLPKSSRTTDIYISGYSYVGGEWTRKHFKLYKVTSSEFVINDLFDGLQGVYVFPRNNRKYQRNRILSVDIERNVGLNLREKDVIGSAKKELLPSTKFITVQHLGVWYYGGNYSREIMRVNVIPGELTEIKHSEVYYNMSASSENSGVIFEVLDFYAYTTFVRISGVSEETEIIIYGSPYTKLSERFETRSLEDAGSDVEIINPITKNQNSAEIVADWALQYYKWRNQYEIDVLGYPECDAGDYVSYENKEVVVLENTISIQGGAMRGKMKLRGGNS